MSLCFCLCLSLHYILNWLPWKSLHIFFDFPTDFYNPTPNEAYSSSLRHSFLHLFQASKSTQWLRYLVIGYSVPILGTKNLKRLLTSAKVQLRSITSLVLELLYHRYQNAQDLNRWSLPSRTTCYWSYNGLVFWLLVLQWSDPSVTPIHSLSITHKHDSSY